MTINKLEKIDSEKRYKKLDPNSFELARQIQDLVATNLVKSKMSITMKINY